MAFAHLRGRQAHILERKPGEMQSTWMHSKDTGYKVHDVRHMEDRKVQEELRMTELRSARGNIIGQVDLGELRKWQRELDEESSRVTDREKQRKRGGKHGKLNELA